MLPIVRFIQLFRLLTYGCATIAVIDGLWITATATRLVPTGHAWSYRLGFFAAVVAGTGWTACLLWHPFSGVDVGFAVRRSVLALPAFLAAEAGAAGSLGFSSWWRYICLGLVPVGIIAAVWFLLPRES
jgi:hypothetical protein